jgi:hypothetical protein
MNQWDNMNSGQIFRHVTRGMMMVSVSFTSKIFYKFSPLILPSFKLFFVFVQATQGVLSMESRVLRITEELQKKGADYKKLEDQHFKNIKLMKEAEEQARVEVENRKKMEVELAEQKEKVRKLESECIATIERARIDGIAEGKAEGKSWGMRGL